MSIVCMRGCITEHRASHQPTIADGDGLLDIDILHVRNDETRFKRRVCRTKKREQSITAEKNDVAL